MSEAGHRMEGDPGAHPLPCPRCGGPVNCGMRAGRKTCWCFDLPHAMTVPDAARTAEDEACLCERCLRAQIEAARQVSREGIAESAGPES